MSNSNLLGKSKSQKVDWEKLRKYMPEPQRDNNGNVMPWDDSTATQNFLVTSALNAMQREKEDKQYEKQRKAEQEEMARREQQRMEEDKRRAELPKVPRGQVQFNMLLSGNYPRHTYSWNNANYSFKMTAALLGEPIKIHQYEGADIKVIDIEPGLRYMRELYRENKLIQLDDDTHKLLMQFAKEDETIPDLINRLIDSATVATAK
jgi:hypothetical protein